MKNKLEVRVVDELLHVGYTDLRETLSTGFAKFEILKVEYAFVAIGIIFEYPDHPQRIVKVCIEQFRVGGRSFERVR